MKKLTILLCAVMFVRILALASSTEKMEKRIYKTKPINPHAPIIDGKLNDPIWDKVEWEMDFVQRIPHEGKDPSQQTAFKILYDEKYIYVAILAYDSELEKIEKRMSRRDNQEGDWVGIEIDSYFDHRTAFSFSVNAAGVKGDEFISEDGDNSDPNWDPIWYVETADDEQGWTAEMRIPLSQLRYGKKEEQIWGLQVTRHLFRKEETSNWQFIPRDAGGWVHKFGELHGLRDLKTSRQIELYPYTVGQIEMFQSEAGNPFATGRSSRLMGGLDGKIGITSDLTLDFTINPDFGQVEADPSVVNLTAYETYFVEKRPFFIEGRNILDFRLMLGDGDFSSDTLFYSRRIGRRPQYELYTEEGEYVDMPQNTSILGAFKLTGKTKKGLSIGLVETVTARERATLSFQEKFWHEVVEPLTNYFGFRLQKDYNEGNTVIGAMVTATNRNIQNEELDFLHEAAFSGGLDLYHTWKNKTYFFQANAVFSHVRGSTETILRTQMSPLRYFQRPDASHVSLDPDRTSLFGHGGSVIFGKLGSGHFQYLGGVTWRSPSLELNDMGYQHYADKIMEFIWASYRIWEPFSIFRRINVGFNQWRGWDFGGANIFDGGNIYVSTQFKNYWSADFGVNRNAESLSSSALRGGPSMRWPGRWNTWYSLESDNRKKIRMTLRYSNALSDDNDSQFHSFEMGMTFNPTNALSLSIRPSYSVDNEELQYVETLDYDDEERYVFARIDQKTFAVTIRLNFSLTPDLSIQFYGQPFVSAGKYSEFKRITDPRAEEFRERFYIFSDGELNYDTVTNGYDIDENRDGVEDYSFANPGFNFLQFRSNLVVRWEYKPGSVLYLVWSQGRTGISSVGDLSLFSDMGNLFEIYPQNVFLIKLSYGFNL